MKKISKVLVTMIFALAVIFATFVPSFAASSPAQVKSLKASTITYNSVKLTWSKASNSNKYYIERSTDGKKWTVLSNTTSTSYTATKLTTGTTYKFRVRGYKTWGKTYGKYSAVVSAKPVPAQVTGVKATTTATTANLTWTKVTGATGYYVFNGSKKVATVKTNTATIKSLTTNTTYKFTVQAYTTVSKSNITGKASSAISVKPVVPQVTGLKATVSNPTTVTLKWTAVSGATSYIVYSGSTKVTTVKTNSATVSNLVPGTTYKYKVKAFVGTVGGTVSSVVSAKPTVTAPSALKATASANSVTLTWTASSSAVTGYYVYNGSDLVATVKYGTNKATVKNLTAATKYTFKVVAYYSTYVSSAVSATAYTTCAAPANVKTVAVGSTSASVSWDAVAGADGYYVYNGSKKLGSTTSTYYDLATTASTKYTIYVYAYTKVSGSAVAGAKSAALTFTTAATELSKVTLTKVSINSTEAKENLKVTWSFLGTYGTYKHFVTDNLSTAAEPYSTLSAIYQFTADANKFNASASESAGYTTVSWDAVEGARYYEVQTSYNADDIKSWTTLDTTTTTSSKLCLPADTTLSIRVVAYNRILLISAYNYDNANSVLGTKATGDTMVVAPGYISNILENYNTASYTLGGSDNMSKTKTVLKAIDAINQTKAEQDKVTVNSTAKIDASTDQTQVVYKDGLGVTHTGNLDFLFDIIKQLPGGEDLTDELQSSMGEDETCSFEFENGYGTGTVTTADKTTTSAAYLQQFISPTDSGAYLYNAADVSSINSKISNITYSVSNGVTTISFKINQEKATPSAPYTRVHDGIVEGFSEAVESMAELDSSSYLTSGATTVKVVINSDGTLNSMNTVSPFSFNMTMDAGDTEMLTLTFKKIIMVLSGSVTHTYTFTR